MRYIQSQHEMLDTQKREKIRAYFSVVRPDGQSVIEWVEQFRTIVSKAKSLHACLPDEALCENIIRQSRCSEHIVNAILLKKADPANIGQPQQTPEELLHLITQMTKAISLQKASKRAHEQTNQR